MASTNVMLLRVMKQLGLMTTRLYQNVCAMDARYSDIQVLIDIVVIDVPDSWGMPLSRKFAHGLGGTLQIDLSYATIPS
jgi:hypothetical protein